MLIFFLGLIWRFYALNVECFFSYPENFTDKESECGLNDAWHHRSEHTEEHVAPLRSIHAEYLPVTDSAGLFASLSQLQLIFIFVLRLKTNNINSNTDTQE